MLCFVLGWIDVALLCIPVSVFFYICGAKPTWRQEYRILQKKHGDRSIPYMCLVMGHCVFISLPSTTTNFPASHYYYEASHFAASFAVCCSTILYYMPVFGTLCLPHVLNDKGCKCKCKVGSCPKLSCCFLCFPERERGETLHWSAGSCCHDFWELSAAPS